LILLFVIGIAVTAFVFSGRGTGPVANGEARSSSPPAASPISTDSTGPAGESFETIFAGRRTLQAGKTVTVPLKFEGAHVATVALYAPTGSLTARIGRTTLVEEPLGNGFSAYNADLTDPVDGDLVITNEAASAVDVDGTADIITARQLVVSAPATGIAGQPFAVEVTLSNGAEGEVPSVTLLDAANSMTPIAMIATGPGAWTGTVVPPHPGGYRVTATVGGDQPRFGLALVTVADVNGDFGL
jgi:hypothetical protein